MKFERSTIVTLSIMFIIIILLSWWIWNSKQQQREKMLDESLASAILQPASSSVGFQDIQGNKISLQEYVGEVVVLYSWASWCPGCADDLLELNNLAAQYSDEVTFLAINRAESAATAQRFIEKKVATDLNFRLILDSDDTFYDVVIGQTMPELVILGFDGGEVHRQRNSLNIPLAEREIKLLISTE